MAVTGMERLDLPPANTAFHRAMVGVLVAAMLLGAAVSGGYGFALCGVEANRGEAVVAVGFVDAFAYEQVR